jgi:hypothetical protein
MLHNVLTPWQRSLSKIISVKHEGSRQPAQYKNPWKPVSHSQSHVHYITCFMWVPD